MVLFVAAAALAILFLFIFILAVVHHIEKIHRKHEMNSSFNRHYYEDNRYW